MSDLELVYQASNPRKSDGVVEIKEGNLLGYGATFECTEDEDRESDVCKEHMVTASVKDKLITGPLGVWKFPLINKLTRDTIAIIFSGSTNEMRPGSNDQSHFEDNTDAVDESGEYVIELEVEDEVIRRDKLVVTE